MNLKQYPLLLGVLSFLGLVFLAGTGFTVWQHLNYTQNKKALLKAGKARECALYHLPRGTIKKIPENSTGPKREKTPEELLQEESDKCPFSRSHQPIAPTDGNLVQANQNLERSKVVENDLFTTLQGQKRFVVDTRQQSSTDLVTKLREARERLTRQVVEKGARLVPQKDFGFGFQRYVDATDASTPPATHLADLSLENEIIEYLVGRLLVAKVAKEDLLVLQTIQREPVERSAERGGASSRASVRDEYVPLSVETLRREGIIQSYYFRITFTSRTDLLRRFTNMIYNSEYPILMRGLTVSQAKAEVLQDPEGATPATTEAPPPPLADGAPALAGFPPPLPSADGTPATSSSSPAEQASKATVIIKDEPREYTVSFEYVIPLKPPPEKMEKPASN